MAVEKALVSGIQVAKLYNMLEKNRVLSKHLINVMQISTSIALQMGLHDELLEVVRRSALLHDIGKLEVFNNESTMLQHPIKGSELLVRKLNNTKLLGFNEIVKAVYHHHERWDGQGYPDGLKGDEIPIAARIIAVADAYDDMTSGRPYRKKRMSSKDAFKQILESTGTQFDLEVVGYFALTDYSPYL